MQTLLEKYDVPGPRYTSYPTVPHWDSANHNEKVWKESLANCFQQSDNEISIYIHLPFCESLCTYCGCTTRITKNHSVELTYIPYLLKEWRLYKNSLGEVPIIKEIHLGGGTPTFFSAENLKLLINGILLDCTLAEDFEFGFEGHPGNTTEAHLRVLASLGFTRVSFGIQDFDPLVQKTINRKQSYQQVEEVCRLARKHGFTSINFDLIYGLPSQSLQSIEDTISKTIALAPNRIAYYSYAHVPWIKAAQLSYEEQLPCPKIKSKMYQLGKQLLTAAGYMDVGMDHFALPQDNLYQAFLSGTLHRSFMGYTTQATKLLIGLGMSAISDSWTAFNQNHKLISNYYQSLDKNEFPIFKGHQLTEDDLIVREHILNLMCRFETLWNDKERLDLGMAYDLELLDTLKEDGLIIRDNYGIKVSDAGKPYIRNICMALDKKLLSSTQKIQFSQTV